MMAKYGKDFLSTLTVPSTGDKLIVDDVNTLATSVKGKVVYVFETLRTVAFTIIMNEDISLITY